MARLEHFDKAHFTQEAKAASQAISSIPFFPLQTKEFKCSQTEFLSSASEQGSRNKASQTRCSGFDFLTARGGLTRLRSCTAVDDTVWEEHAVRETQRRFCCKFNSSTP